ncbi:hypothetical protein FA137_24570 [Pseudomonas aeruginosa]|nr:hypothetical protein [Pseudomonas aeruginosa]TGW20675.1 hypothetical protein E4417_07020 [Stenotrophomonas maltophilia]
MPLTPPPNAGHFHSTGRDLLGWLRPICGANRPYNPPLPKDRDMTLHISVHSTFLNQGTSR